MARSANQKLKLLYLMRYLLRNSDENHPVTVRQMGEYLRGQGISAERKSLYDEAGDPLRRANDGGLAYLKASLENALDAMLAAGELAGYVVDIPSGQNVARDGVSVEITLIGIPIIREIRLYNRYTYAGSTFDPRIEDYALAG